MSFKAIGEGGREVRLSFSHGRRKIEKGKHAGMMKRFIEAHVLTPTVGQHVVKDGVEYPVLTLLGMGVASCSFEDAFSSEEGRRIAMERAFADALRIREEGQAPLLSQEEAGALKKAYFTRKDRKASMTSSGGGGGMDHRTKRLVGASLTRQRRSQNGPPATPLQLPPDLIKEVVLH